MVESRSSFNILRDTGMGPLESPRRRWEDNIRKDRKEINRYQYEQLGLFDPG